MDPVRHDGLQLRERLESGLAQTLVFGHHPGLALDRHDLLAEAPFGPCHRCALLREHTERVGALARHAPFLADGFRGLKLVQKSVAFKVFGRDRPTEAELFFEVGADGNAAH